MSRKWTFGDEGVIRFIVSDVLAPGEGGRQGVIEVIGRDAHGLKGEIWGDQLIPITQPRYFRYANSPWHIIETAHEGGVSFVCGQGVHLRKLNPGDGFTTDNPGEAAEGEICSRCENVERLRRELKIGGE